jgi:hypothetical protein
MRELVRAHGSLRVSTMLGLSRAAIDRVAGCLPVRPGTIALATQRIDALERGGADAR